MVAKGIAARTAAAWGKASPPHSAAGFRVWARPNGSCFGLLRLVRVRVLAGRPVLS